MIKHLHHKLFHSSTPFAYATVAGLVIGLGDVFATSADLIWLYGDASRDYHSYHGLVAIGLIIAELVMLASFIWLYRAAHNFLKKKESKERKTIERVSAIEKKLDAIQFYFEQIEEDEEVITAQTGMAYIPDPALLTLVKEFNKHNRGAK